MMFPSAKISVVWVLSVGFAVSAHAQSAGSGGALGHVTPTGAITIPQAEVPSVGTLETVQPHWVFVN